MNPIRECRIERGLSQQRLADLVGVHQTAVSQWEKGRTAPDKQSLLRLSSVLAVSADRLLGAEKESGGIPVLGYVRAGRPNDASQQVLGYESRGGLGYSSGELFALRIRGDSMEPRFVQGDTVIVKRTDEAPNGSICVVLVGPEEATVKKAETHNGTLTLTALNPAYEPLVFTPEQVESLPVRIIGRVIELRARF
ncbi:MAG: helix-turn-helix domain-containing protein [Clostridia bacterium]|nr:helix-turn-helix domain-containing protein [Clostridia bacterium]